MAGKGGKTQRATEAGGTTKERRKHFSHLRCKQKTKRKSKTKSETNLIESKTKSNTKSKSKSKTKSKKRKRIRKLNPKQKKALNFAMECISKVLHFSRA